MVDNKRHEGLQIVGDFSPIVTIFDLRAEDTCYSFLESVWNFGNARLKTEKQIILGFQSRSHFIA